MLGWMTNAGLHWHLKRATLPIIGKRRIWPITSLHADNQIKMVENAKYYEVYLDR